MWERDRVCGLRYTAERGRGATCTARASVIVCADGRFSFVGDAVEAAFYNVVPPQNFPFYTYYRGVEPVDPPVFPIWESSNARGTVMLVPCDEDIWMRESSIPGEAQAEYDTFRRDHVRLFEERMRADQRVAPELVRAERIAPVRGRGDLVNFLRVPAGRGWALVGDAGQHKDPIFGQGIGDAVHCGEGIWRRNFAAGLGGDLDAVLASCTARADPGSRPEVQPDDQAAGGGRRGQQVRSARARCRARRAACVTLCQHLRRWLQGSRRLQRGRGRVVETSRPSVRARPA